jgi:hypothetical protein
VTSKLHNPSLARALTTIAAGVSVGVDIMEALFKQNPGAYVDGPMASFQS